MKNNLPYPYSEALKRKNSIGYKVSKRSKENDHEYVRKLGYTPEMGGDCSYSAIGLDGLNLSSSGVWGAYYPSFANKESTDVFLDMYERGIIELWDITAYIDDVNGFVNSFSYEKGKGWKKYDPEYGWSSYNGDPYKDFPR